MRSKLICLFLVLCLATFVGIVGCGKEAVEVEKKAEEVEEAEGPVKEALPEKGRLGEPKEAVEKKAEEVEEVEGPKTIQGPVRSIDRAANTITVSGVTLDAGSVDLTEIYVGTWVKVTYQRDERVIQSIEVLPLPF